MYIHIIKSNNISIIYKKIYLRLRLTLLPKDVLSEFCIVLFFALSVHPEYHGLYIVVEV